MLIIVGTAILRQASESHWKKFTSGEGAFSILMPGRPKEEKETQVINGMKLDVHQFSAWSRTDGEFSVGYVDAPVLPTVDAGERMLDAERQSLTHGDGNRLLSIEKMNVNGYSVRQYKAIVDKGLQADEKLYLVKRRLYILLVVHDKDRDEGDVKKFFDSFTFEPKE